MMSIMMLILIGAMFAGCAAPPTPAPEAPKEIKIGAVVSLKGAGAVIGLDMGPSAELAATHINAKGGVFVKEFNKTIPVKVFLADDEGTADGAVKATRKLVLEDKVDVLTGGFGTAPTMAGEAVAAENKVPFVITGASNPAVTRRTDLANIEYMFHHCPTTDDYSEQTMLFVNQVIKPAIYAKYNFSSNRSLRVAVIYQSGGYGSGVLNGTEKAIAKHNLNFTIVEKQSYTPDATDFRAQLTKIKDAKPDVIYPAAWPGEQINIVKQGRNDLGIKSIFLSVECNDLAAYYTGIGSWGEYSIQESRFGPYANPLFPEISTKYLEDFKTKNGRYPGMMGASTYDGVFILAKAIENAGTLNKTKVRDALASLEMPAIVEPMKEGKIVFSKDYRESKFEIFMEQLFMNSTLGETRPKIVWPDKIKETNFVLPPWYEPGS